jgi:hypothetical protein
MADQGCPRLFSQPKDIPGRGARPGRPPPRLSRTITKQRSRQRTIVDPEGSGRHATTQIFPSSPVKPGAPRVRRHKPGSSARSGKGTDRPLRGTSTGTLTASLVTGAATSSFTGHICSLGAITGGDVVTFTVTGPTTFTYTGTDTLVAANGNEVFSTLTGSGAFTSTTTTQSTQVNTITGGTGRYADASGTFTETISSVVVSVTATSETTDNAATFNGQISY